jgi:hypothetical protein
LNVPTVYILDDRIGIDRPSHHASVDTLSRQLLSR